MSSNIESLIREHKNMTILAVLFVLTLFIVGPLVTIWSINTLFGLGISYSFWTWLATVWLTTLFASPFIKNGS